MAPKFIFEAPSDEELEHSHSDGEEDDYEGGDDDREEDAVPRKTQSPWDFSSNFESVDEEHARRGTTSVDAKISKLRKESSISIPNIPDSDISDSESNKQEDYRPDVDDAVEDDDEASEEEAQEEESKPEEEEDAEDVDDDEEVEDDEEEDDDEEEKEEEEEEQQGTTKIVDKKSFFASSDGASFHASSFMELNLSRPLLRACKELGFTKPTPIQAACIPLALAGRDICGSAMTGSGKTAAFALPTLERLLFRPKRDQAIRVLILTPTRELAAQVHSMIEKLAQFTDIRCCLVVGGLDMQAQAAALRSMPDIVVATPGRIIDHLTNSMSVSLDDLAVLILDEADRLLELGFSADIRELLRLCPKRRQTMLFSATMTEEVNELIKFSLTKPLRLSADPSTKRPATLTEEVVRIRRMREVNQEAVLLALCSKTFTSKVIIFSGTKQAAHRLKILFTLFELKAAELHGNLTQNQRLNALDLFKEQKVDFLIATDVAARGLDIVGVQTVINYACPRDLTSYVHRVGRTARAGRKGYAVTLVTDTDRSLLKAIAKRAGSKLKSRTVAEQSIANWSKKIDEMEAAVTAVLEEERQEAELRKAEMEVRKAENLITHKDDIFSRPKKTWHLTEKQKKLVAKAAKDYAEKGKGPQEDVVSAQQAEDLKMKEKRKREREKNLPRRQRRKLEAAREMLEDENHNDKSQGNGRNNKEKAGVSLVDVAYRRAKAVKKAEDSGKIVRKASNKPKGSSKRTQSRTGEMEELFQGDMSERKQKSGVMGKKSKRSFKSKSRYKRK